MARPALALLAAMALAGTARADTALTVETYAAGPDGMHATSSLILGATEAILVDAQLTRSEAHRVVAVLLDSKRRLTAVYITHPHPDHYFGLEVIKQAFPKAKLLAAPVVVADIKKTAAAAEKALRPRYGDNLGKPVYPTPYKQTTLDLEGETIELIALEPGESSSGVVVHVPSIKTVIAGDVVSAGVHPWLAEADAEERASWRKNLDRIKALSPTTVIPGHRAPAAATDTTGSGAVEFTLGYLTDFDAAAAAATTAAELEAKILANPKYKDLALPASLGRAAAAAVAVKK
jgi:glyoxylase-like metal-dependent hydrolase (beta-lactamase superfamily II)